MSATASPATLLGCFVVSTRAAWTRVVALLCRNRHGGNRTPLSPTELPAGRQKFGVAAATPCSASGAWAGNLSTSGSRSTGPLVATSTFSRASAGPGVTITREVSVAVESAGNTPPVGGGGSGGGGLTPILRCFPFWHSLGKCGALDGYTLRQGSLRSIRRIERRCPTEQGLL